MASAERACFVLGVSLPSSTGINDSPTGGVLVAGLLFAVVIHFVVALFRYGYKVKRMSQAKNPSLSSERALLAANVALQIVKAMRTLYSESEAKARPLIEAEFRKLLTSYLRRVLSEGE